MTVSLKSGPKETLKKSKISVTMFRDEMVNLYTLMFWPGKKNWLKLLCNSKI